MTIEIQLNGVNYLIEDDGRSHNAIKLGHTEAGKPTATNIGYCMSLSKAVNKIVRDSLASKEETVSLKEYVDKYERLLDECKTEVDF